MLGTRSVQRALGDYLGGEDLLRLHVRHLVAFGETATAEGFAAGVFFDDDFSVGFCHLFLDYDGIAVVLLLNVRLGFHYILKIILLNRFQ